MKNPALILIDVQKAFDDPSWGVRNNPDAEVKISGLLAAWRDKGWPVIHVKHCSTEPSSTLRPEAPGNAFKDEALPLADEKVFSKKVNSAFIGTGLEQYLRENEIDKLVMAGLTTDHCVSTSTRMAGNLGFDVTLVSDATVTFDRVGEDGTHYTAEQIHEIHLLSLSGEFCRVMSCAEVLSQDSFSQS